MKFNYNKIALYTIGILLIFEVIIISFWAFTGDKSQKIITDDESAKIVRDYFNYWDKKNYESMYNLISDGFKEKEPTAKNLIIYKAYMNSLDVNRVRIVDLTNVERGYNTSRIGYTVEFIKLNGMHDIMSSEFTVVNKTRDTIPGLKLIHPYGKIVDN